MCANSPHPLTSIYPFATNLTFFLVTSPSDPTFSANTRWPSWTHMSMGHSTSMKTPFHHKLLYSSVIASTHSSMLTCPIASWYEQGASTVKNNAPPSLLPSGSVPPVLVVSALVPPEVGVSCCTASIDGFFVGGLDPSCSLGSSSGQVGGMPLLVWVDLWMVGVMVGGFGLCDVGV